MDRDSVAISVDDLQPGMFVAYLDRPWLETPFQIQGITIFDEQDIATLKKYCNYVYVDRETLPDSMAYNGIEIKPKQVPTKPLQSELSSSKPGRYSQTVEFAEELENAKCIKNTLSSTLSEVFDDLSNGQSLDLAQIKQILDPMVDSVIRNPDAMIWLTRLKHQGGYIYRHAMSVSIWSVAIGRQLGLPRNQLSALAIGALLADVGKIDIPSTILEKPDHLTEAEFNQVKCHVTKGIEILNNSEGITDTIRNIVLYHHERHQGQGYPEGLSGSDIPVFARIVGLADCFDAITSIRPYRRPLSSSEAIKKLYEWRDLEFQKELVEEFIQSIGIYPAGTLIELSDGSVAIVVATGRENRLRPRVMIVLDKDKRPVSQVRIVDLARQDADSEGGCHIEKSLPNEAYGIDPDEYYI